MGKSFSLDSLLGVFTPQGFRAGQKVPAGYSLHSVFVLGKRFSPDLLLRVLVFDEKFLPDSILRVFALGTRFLLGSLLRVFVFGSRV